MKPRLDSIVTDAVRPPLNPRRAQHWVVTCAERTAYESLLVPFLGSLWGVARWDGQVAVLDYGLTDAQIERLAELGVAVEPVARAHFVNLDRFLQLASFADQHEGLIAHWDADVWFPEQINPLFDGYARRRSSALVCSVDGCFQSSCYGVARDEENLRHIQTVLELMVARYGNILQCGFTFGRSAAIGDFCKYLAQLIASREFKPLWNSDTVGLNYFAYQYPERLEVIDHRYNCLPDWFPEWDGRHYRSYRRIMRVIHLTSPWRASPDGIPYSFPHRYAAAHGAWAKRLKA